MVLHVTQPRQSTAAREDGITTGLQKDPALSHPVLCPIEYQIPRAKKLSQGIKCSMK